MMYSAADLSARPIHSDRRDYGHSAAPLPPTRDAYPVGPCRERTPAANAYGTIPGLTAYRIPADLSPAAPACDDAAPTAYVPTTRNVPATDIIDGPANLAAAYDRAATRYARAGRHIDANTCANAALHYTYAANAADLSGMPAHYPGAHVSTYDVVAAYERRGPMSDFDAYSL